MKQCKIIHCPEERKFKLEVDEGNQSILAHIVEYFSIKKTNFSYYRKCKMRGIKPDPSKASFYKKIVAKDGKFDYGLLFDVVSRIKSTFPSCKVYPDPFAKAYTSKKEFSIDLTLPKCNLSPRDYQISAVEVAAKYRQGLFIMATSAGKTLITALMCKVLVENQQGRRILITTPFPALARQTFEEIHKFLDGTGVSVSSWFEEGDKLDRKSNVIVTSAHRLRNENEIYKDDLEFLMSETDTVICDEVHSVKKENVIGDIISQFRTPYRYGFTGSLPLEREEVTNLISVFGPVRIEVSSSDLREAKTLNEIKGLIVHCPLSGSPTPPEERYCSKTGLQLPVEGRELYRAELDFIVSHPEYHEYVTSVTSRLSGNTLVLVDSLELIDNLVAKYVKDGMVEGKNLFVISGSVPLDEREDIKKMMEENDKVVCIAMYSVFSTGISVNRIHNVMFASSSKSFTRIVQSIGRGLRNHATKKFLRVIDMVPSLPYMQKHLEKRKEYYDKEKINFIEKSFSELTK